VDLPPTQYSLVSSDWLVDVDMIRVTQSNLARGLLKRYRGEGFDGIDVDGLQDILRTGEDDRGIA
jgi:hypothetical protein